MKMNIPLSQKTCSYLILTKIFLISILLTGCISNPAIAFNKLDIVDVEGTTIRGQIIKCENTYYWGKYCTLWYRTIQGGEYKTITVPESELKLLMPIKRG